MSMTMSQKILAAHYHLDEVRPGQMIMADLDLVLGNDITARSLSGSSRNSAWTRCSTRPKSCWSPTISPRTKTSSPRAMQCMREFAYDHEIENYFEIGQMGIEHALLPNRVWWEPGTSSSGQTAIPAPMVLWALSPLAWEAPTWPRRWPQAKRGSKSQPPCVSTSPAL